MKIGILTFWWSDDNYGQLLQCYALQKYLRDAGHDAYLIRYSFEHDFVRSDSYWRKIFKLKKIINYLRTKMRLFTSKSEANKNPREFNQFRDKYLKNSNIYSSYKQLQEDPPDADVYIVGSDQVWNIDDSQINLLRAYFLDFGSTNTIRMSYAASFGRNALTKQYIATASALLKKFKYVSVRERDAVDLCELCGVNAEWVVDPTMLVDVSIYNNIITDNKQTNRFLGINKYCVLYLLNNECDLDIAKLFQWCETKKLKVIYITGNARIDKYEKVFPTIPEWLFLIQNAEFVVTNSFHCCVFSLLFSKQFAVSPLIGPLEGMNTRISSLFTMFEINRMLRNNDFQILENEIDGEKIKDKIAQLKQSSFRTLLKA